MNSNHRMHVIVSKQPHKKHIKSSKKFSQKKVNLAQMPLIFPEGFEKIFLSIYFFTLPYIAGLLFLFFYVAGGKLEVFSSLNKESSYILTWCIGYQIIATIILLYIIKMALGFATESRKPGIKQFRRP